VLARAGSEKKVPAGCTVAIGNVFDRATYLEAARGADAFIHLVGVAHPSPAKAAEFEAIDFKAAEQAIDAASELKTPHFIYVSVAHPAPIMKEYIAVRSRCESLIHQRNLNASIVRPWYVIGPGHYWPLLLLPGYWLGGLLPATRDSARRLGLVKLRDMVLTLAHCVEAPAGGIRVIEVPEIRRLGRGTSVNMSAHSG
jgi:uncharacterized protein YbjT (DUF2867 family)